MKDSNNIIIHINETLDSENRKKLTGEACKIAGVASANMKGKRPHLMIIGFNPLETKPVNIISEIRNTGVHAQLVSWL